MSNTKTASEALARCAVMTKSNWFALAVVPALAVALVPQAGKAQDERAPKRERLVRVAEGADPAERTARETDEARAFDRNAWKAKLGNRDLAARERDFDTLLELARRDGAAREALEAWSQDDAAGELAWTSRLALRELGPARRAGGGGWWQRTTPRSFAGPDFEALQRQMDDLHRQFGGMDDLFGDLQRRMDSLFQRGAPGLAPGVPGRVDSHSSFSLRSGPDGVEVEVEDGQGDERHTQTYKAESLEELLEQHPELKDRIQGDGQGFLFGGPGGAPRARSFGFTTPFGGGARTLTPGAEPPRLGLQCRPPTEDEAKELGLEAGVGLRTSEVVAGSLAERLGIRAGDVLVELDGTVVKDRETVAEVLRARKPGDELRATIVDAKGKRRTLTYVQKLERGHDAQPGDGARF
ncbi:MAG: PDZ domain-containing protein [Planctomycetes bacterium]|nr:PDZ domain-containing protein [Planctomycetota bacterium]